MACFHHAINDIHADGPSEPRGMDTTAVDWFPNERQMIEWLAEDVQAGRLGQRGQPELLQIVADAVASTSGRPPPSTTELVPLHRRRLVPLGPLLQPDPHGRAWIAEQPAPDGNPPEGVDRSGS